MVSMVKTTNPFLQADDPFQRRADFLIALLEVGAKSPYPLLSRIEIFYDVQQNSRNSSSAPELL
jgi:hypothetical protein